jgi:hypothetical protein
MADEISFNLRFDVTNGTYKPGPIVISGLTIDQAAAGESGGTITVTTSDNVTLPHTSIANPGWLYLRNIESSTAKFIAWGFSTGALSAIMYTSEFALLRTTTGAEVYAKQTGGTGGCKMHYRWLES